MTGRCATPWTSERARSIDNPKPSPRHPRCRPLPGGLDERSVLPNNVGRWAADLERVPSRSLKDLLARSERILQRSGLVRQCRRSRRYAIHSGWGGGGRRPSRPRRGPIRPRSAVRGRGCGSAPRWPTARTPRATARVPRGVRTARPPAHPPAGRLRRSPAAAPRRPGTTPTAAEVSAEVSVDVVVLRPLSPTVRRCSGSTGRADGGGGFVPGLLERFDQLAAADHFDRALLDVGLHQLV